MANGETKVTLDKDGNIRVVLGDKLKEGLNLTYEWYLDNN